MADNLFDDFNLSGESLDPQLFGSDIRLGTASLKASLDGPFRDATIEHELTVARLEIGEINVVRLQQAGIGQLEGGVFRIPLALSIEKIDAFLATAREVIVELRAAPMARSSALEVPERASA